MKPLRYLWALPNTVIGLALILLALITARTQRVRGSWEKNATGLSSPAHALRAGCGPEFQCHIHTDVVEASGGLLTWLLTHATLLEGGASAITFGHVVLARDHHTLDLTRSHERIHVRQYERFGPFFLPIYLISSLIAKIRGLDAYRDNIFEREAFGTKT